jgi:hypothetical protein
MDTYQVEAFIEEKMVEKKIGTLKELIDEEKEHREKLPEEKLAEVSLDFSKEKKSPLEEKYHG